MSAVLRAQLWGCQILPDVLFQNRHKFVIKKSWIIAHKFEYYFFIIYDLSNFDAIFLPIVSVYNCPLSVFVIPIKALSVSQIIEKNMEMICP